MEKIKRQSTNRMGKILLALFLLILFFRLPIPYYIESPGSAVALEPLVKIDGQEKEMPGTYMLTTVRIMQATPALSFTALLPFHDGLSRSSLLGTAENYEEYDTLQRFYMENSKNTAIEAAFNAASLPITREYHGIYVMRVLEESDFYGKIHPGDTISAIDGMTFESSQEFMDYIKAQEVDQTVTITYERDGHTDTVSGDLIQLSETGNPGIGISLVDHSTIETEPSVEIDSGLIGGPSAGFMFALQIYTLLENPDLTGGMEIAGTGTITPDGTIGRIGGIAKKVVAADGEGADIFFAPDDDITSEMKQINPDLKSNYEEAVDAAEAIGTEMKVVPVKHLKDAVEYLEEHS
ncbi:SepM family pheromone-processing serine protease [Atopococcus tabaci]|uniref:SepM family pheromone-processing serine protease n=1 Tax=Atopococcus tabaci TaxID=269774 RepID=UPI0024090CFC|nr:SepM family pheromone-processing serine protease [Atopococcus tabaci]